LEKILQPLPSEKNLLEKAHNTAEKTISGMGHRIGCVIKCWDGKEFLGVTKISWSTAGRPKYATIRHMIIAPSFRFLVRFKNDRLFY